MNAKRSCHVMLRLTDEEFEALSAAKPDGEEVAVFARRTILAALSVSRQHDVRLAAAFVVAALSSDIGFAEALELFDTHCSHVEGS